MWSKNRCYQTIKKCTPKVFLDEKKIRKTQIENWLWKSNFGTFWHLSITAICKIQWFHFNRVDFLPNFFLILYFSLENSTIGIAILVITFFALLSIAEFLIIFAFFC